MRPALELPNTKLVPDNIDGHEYDQECPPKHKVALVFGAHDEGCAVASHVHIDKTRGDKYVIQRRIFLHCDEEQGGHSYCEGGNELRVAERDESLD